MDARHRLAAVLVPVFRKTARSAAHDVMAAYHRITKKVDGDGHLTSEEIAEILDAINLSAWPDEVVEGVRAEIAAMMADGGAAAFAQIGVAAVPEELTQVHEAAVAFAKERAAELVGMKWVGDELVPNPDAQWAITDSTRDMLRADVVDVLESGETTDALADRLAANYAFSADRAETIARTELARADVAGNMAAYRASGEVSGKQWLLGSEHDDTDECDEAADMGVVDLDDDFGGIGDPPAHPRCFLPDTLVAATGVAAHFRRWFEGEVVTVRTERQQFTATPNHPVLTGRGWVAVGALEVGDYLLECSDPRAAVLLLNPHDHQVPARIEDVARTLQMAGRVTAVRVPTAAADFHGDGVPRGEVEIIRPARPLVADGEAHTAQDSGDARLRLGHGEVGGLSRGGAADLLLEGDGTPTDGSVRGLRSPLPLGGTDARGLDPVRLGGVADGEPVTLEQLPDGGAVAIEALRQLDSRLASLVHPVQIVEIGKRDFAGHVYNLSTEGEWYFASAMIVHNCVCDVLPVLREADDDGGDDASEDGS